MYLFSQILLRYKEYRLYLKSFLKKEKKVDYYKLLLLCV